VGCYGCQLIVKLLVHDDRLTENITYCPKASTGQNMPLTFTANVASCAVVAEKGAQVRALLPRKPAQPRGSA